MHMPPSFPKPARRRSPHKLSDEKSAAHDPYASGKGSSRSEPMRGPRPARKQERPGQKEHGENIREPQKRRSFRKDGATSPERGPERFEEASGVDAVETPLLPGVKPVLEFLESTPERVDTVFLRKGRHSKDMDRIADLCRAVGVRFSLLEPSLFSRIYAGGSQGVVARLFEAGYVDLDDLLAKVMDAPLPLLLALDQVRDPGNAGTLARTLYALGGAGIIAPRHNGVYLGAAAAKAAAGALEKLPVAKVGNLGQALDAARKQGFTIYGAAAEKKSSSLNEANSAPVENAFAFRPRLPAVLVLGSEEEGMRPGMEKRCDTLLRIPMLRNFNSLNVAQAGAIIISAFVRSLG